MDCGSFEVLILVSAREPLNSTLLWVYIWQILRPILTIIYQIYTPFLVRSSRGSSRKNKSRIFGLLRNSQFSHLIYARVHAVMPPTNETQHRTPWQISWQGTLEIRGKGHFAKLGTRINMQIKIPDESPRKKVNTLPEAFPVMTPFALGY